MSLADAIQSHNTSRGIDSILEVLDDADREDLLACLNDPSIGHTAIARGLKKHNNLSVSEASIRRWRDRSAAQEVTGL